MKMLRAISILAIWIGAATLQAPSADLPAPGRGPISPSPRFARAAEFLTRMRLADPDDRLFLMAGLKENELSLLLNRSFDPAQVPILLKGLAGQLETAIPGQDWVVIAFWPVYPLREAGTAKIQADTRQVTYQPGAVR